MIFISISTLDLKELEGNGEVCRNCSTVFIEVHRFWKARAIGNDFVPII